MTCSDDSVPMVSLFVGIFYLLFAWGRFWGSSLALVFCFFMFYSFFSLFLFPFFFFFSHFLLSFFLFSFFNLSFFLFSPFFFIPFFLFFLFLSYYWCYYKPEGSESVIIIGFFALTAWRWSDLVFVGVKLHGVLPLWTWIPLISTCSWLCVAEFVLLET